MSPNNNNMYHSPMKKRAKMTNDIPTAPSLAMAIAANPNKASPDISYFNVDLIWSFFFDRGFR